MSGPMDFDVVGMFLRRQRHLPPVDDCFRLHPMTGLGRFRKSGSPPRGASTGRSCVETRSLDGFVVLKVETNDASRLAPTERGAAIDASYTYQSHSVGIVLGIPTLLHPTQPQGSVPTRLNHATCARRHAALGRGGDAHILGGGGAGWLAAEVQLASMYGEPPAPLPHQSAFDAGFGQSAAQRIAILAVTSKKAVAIIGSA
jgi:hypothetical protein